MFCAMHMFVLADTYVCYVCARQLLYTVVTITIVLYTLGALPTGAMRQATQREAIFHCPIRLLLAQHSCAHWSKVISDTIHNRAPFYAVVIMSSSEEDVIIAYRYLRQRKSKARKYWVHPYNVHNIKHSSAVVSRELSQHEQKFKEFYRMSLESYRVLLQLVSRKLEKKNTNFRFAVPPAEKLLITLR